MNETDLDEVCQLELELLEPGTRSNPDRLKRLLHTEFVEIGASGRIWDRAQAIDELTLRPGVGVAVGELTAHEVVEDVALVTYTTSASRRASLWVRTEAGWQVRFHQGTPVPGRATPVS